MLDSVSKRTAHCYWRATEWRKLTALSISATDRQIYLEREQARLTLARSDEFAERNGSLLQEVQSQRGCRYSPPTPKCLFAMSKCNFTHRSPIGYRFKLRCSLSARSFSTRIAGASVTS